MSSSHHETINQTDSPLRPTPPASLRRIILAGFMGAGKSTVGRLLAARLDWEFLDLDTHLENRTGSTIPDLFSRYGEPHFRRLESTALASALSRSNTVLALGGGAPEELTNRLLIEQTPATFAIFLDAPFPTLFDRCMLQDISRPVLADPSLAEVRFARRRPIYSRLAQLIVETSTQSPEETVEAIVATLNHKAHPLS